jgi:hypothetical protein
VRVARLCHDVVVPRSAPWLLALLVAGCSRPDRDPAPPAASTGAAASQVSSEGPLPSAPADPIPAAPSAEAVLPPHLHAPAEARRSVLRRLEDVPAVAAQEGALRSHFDAGVPWPLEAQAVPMAGDRRATLFYGGPRDRSPILIVVDAKDKLLWSRDRPLAGTRQIVTEMALMPGPRGEVALAWCDIPTQIVGLRRWSPEGVPLADFEVASVDVCEALSALYWPGRGFLAVASLNGAARAQLLDENGRRAWGPTALELPWKARPSAPVSIAVDTDVSVMLFQVGDLAREGGGAAPDRVLAMRYDTLGTALWARPIDLGPAPAAEAGAAPRIAATTAEPGSVRVSLGSGRAQLRATVTSVGSILMVPK